MHPFFAGVKQVKNGDSRPGQANPDF